MKRNKSSDFLSCVLCALLLLLFSFLFQSEKLTRVGLPWWIEVTWVADLFKINLSHQSLLRLFREKQELDGEIRASYQSETERSSSMQIKEYELEWKSS